MKVSELTGAQRRTIAYGVFAPACMAFIVAIIMLIYIAYDGSKNSASSTGKSRDVLDVQTRNALYLVPVAVAVVYGIYKVFTGFSAMKRGVCVPGRIFGTGIALAGGNRNVWVSYDYEGKSYGLKTSNPSFVTDPYDGNKQMIVVIKPGNPKKGIPVWSDWPG